jgi:hypothetical protein
MLPPADAAKSHVPDAVPPYIITPRSANSEDRVEERPFRAAIEICPPSTARGSLTRACEDRRPERAGASQMLQGRGCRMQDDDYDDQCNHQENDRYHLTSAAGGKIFLCLIGPADKMAQLLVAQQ